MSNSLFDMIKRKGYIVSPLDEYLLHKSVEGNDRAINVNAPSQAGNCNRANYYARMQYDPDPVSGDIARTERIFDNGTYTHMRLQKYLLDAGILIQDEVPLINDEYNIQGHTDGFIDLGDEIAILEIKSINDKGFSALKDAKEEHKRQGMIYMFCTEERRKYLRSTYKSRKEFNASLPERRKYFESHYQHIQGGSKYSREEKIENEISLNLVSDDILFDTEKPVTKVIFLYEDKDNQMLKEFLLQRSVMTEPILSDTLERYKVLNECCKNETIPEREASNKSECRWCNFKNTCWVV